MAKSINDIVQRCRWDAGYTMADIAEVTGYSASYICLIEHGERRCPESYWLFWAVLEKVKVEDYTAYPNLPEGYGCAKI